MRDVAFVFALLTLAACASPTTWNKAGATQADFQKDTYECERDARMSAASFGGGIVGSMNAREFYDRCMVAHGYAKEAPTGSAANGPAPDTVVSCVTPDNRPIFQATARDCRATGGWPSLRS